MKGARMIRKLLVFLAFVFIIPILSLGQLKYYEDQFAGGVTEGGWSPTYNGQGTGNFIINIAPGSTIRAAYFIAGRLGNAPNVTVQLNGTPYTFNMGNQVTGPFQTLYGGPSGVHLIDLTAVLNPTINNYSLMVPVQNNTSNRYQDFKLFVAYDNPNLAQVNVAFFLNTFNLNQNTNLWTLNFTNQIQTNQDVGVSFFNSYQCNTGGDAEEIYIDNQYIGLTGLNDANSGFCGGTLGNHYYQNGTLTGLGDDNANQAVFGGEALSDVKALIPNNTNTFQVRFDHAGGGSDNHQWNVTVVWAGCQPPTLNMVQTNVLCNGDCTGDATVSATNAVPPYTYQWDANAANQTTAMATGLCAGTYYVTVTDSLACTQVDTVIITEPPALALNFNITNSNCGAPDGSATANASGGTPGYTYQWDAAASNQTAQTATGLPPGSYNITVTDANGCTIVGAVTIAINGNAITVNFVSTNVLCEGDCNGDATANPANGAPPFTFQWDAAAGFQTTQTATGLCAGTYNVTVTDSLGCSGPASVTVTEPPALTIMVAVTSNYNGSEISCNGASDGAAMVTPGGGTPGYLYTWDANANNQTTQTATGLAAGSYTITITDLNGCTKDTTVTLIDPAPVLLTVANDTTICVGTVATVWATGSGGTPGYTEFWNQGLPGNGPHNVSPAVNTCYTVYLEDLNGCASATDSVCVTVLPPITPAISVSDDTICDGESVTITAGATGGNNGPYTYTWSNGGTGQSIVVSPATYPNSATYTVTISDGCSPDVAISITVDFYPTPVPQFTADETMGCEPFTVTFTNLTPNAANCTWLLGDGTVITNLCDTVVHTYEFPGTYDVTLTVTSPEGCTGTVTMPGYIIVNPNPIADFAATPQPTNIYNTTIEFIDLSEGSVYMWNWTFYNNDGNSVLGGDTEQNPVFTYPPDTGRFPVHLFVTTVDGCVDDTLKYIEIEGVYNLFVPNAFTPNNDGLNDEFFPKGVGISEENFLFQIFDRWGEVIFESTDIDDHWDGTARKRGGSDLVQEGVYVWKIKTQEAINRTSDKQRTYIGRVTLAK